MKRRDPLQKPKHLLESTRAQWVGIGLLLMLVVLACNIFVKIDPVPYLQTIMVLIGAGVLGWSVDSAARIFKVESTTTTANSNSESNVNNNTNVVTKNYSYVESRGYKENVTLQGQAGAPEVKPYSQKATDND